MILTLKRKFFGAERVEDPEAFDEEVPEIEIQVPPDPKAAQEMEIEKMKARRHLLVNGKNQQEIIQKNKNRGVRMSMQATRINQEKEQRDLNGTIRAGKVAKAAEKTSVHVSKPKPIRPLRLKRRRQ